jgi:altronate dehydratase small subunit
MTPPAQAILLDARDNVATALADLPAGTAVRCAKDDRRVEARLEAAIPFGHKLAVAPIRAGEPVIKYGAPIGTATRDIAAGEHVHVHNVASARAKPAAARPQP